VPAPLFWLEWLVYERFRRLGRFRPDSLSWRLEVGCIELLESICEAFVAMRVVVHHLIATLCGWAGVRWGDRFVASSARDRF